MKGNDSDAQYYKILQYYLPQYTKQNGGSCTVRKFAPESDIKIIGVYQYEPYNVNAIKQFHSLLSKQTINEKYL